MGLESRDWYREKRRPARSAWSRRDLVIVVVVVVALVLAISPPVRERLGYELPLGLESVFGKDTTPGALRVTPFPGAPGITIGESPLYASDDPWKAWLADERTCPRGEDRSAAAAVQLHVMLCLTNFARQRERLSPLRRSRLLSATASEKASAIARCGTFEHAACGRPADEAARRHGYQGSFGENLYLADPRISAPRVALDRWLNSDGHRENLFRPEWRTVGIALLQDVDVAQVGNGVVWVQQFGD